MRKAPTASLLVNVKDKGRYGDGRTDDTAAIQAAIDEIGGTGGRSLCRTGTYMGWMQWEKMASLSKAI